MSIFENKEEKYRSLRTKYIYYWRRNFINTAESIKGELLRQRLKLPHPAIYNIATQGMLP